MSSIQTLAEQILDKLHTMDLQCTCDFWGPSSYPFEDTCKTCMVKHRLFNLMYPDHEGIEYDRGF